MFLRLDNKISPICTSYSTFNWEHRLTHRHATDRSYAEKRPSTRRPLWSIASAFSVWRVHIPRQPWQVDVKMLHSCMASLVSVVCSSGSTLFEWGFANRLCTPPACASGFTCSFNHSSDSQTVKIIIKSTRDTQSKKVKNQRRTGFVRLRIQCNRCRRPCQINFQHLSLEFVHIHIIDRIQGISSWRKSDESKSSMFRV